MKTLCTTYLNWRRTTPLRKHWLRLGRQGLCLLGLAGLLTGRATAQGLPELDAMLRQPLRNRIITNKAYAEVLAQKQAAVSGLAVAQGKTLGTNVTIGDKSVGLNVGLTDIKLTDRNRLALTANGTFTSDQGFVKLFSEENPHIMASYGGTLFLFGQGQHTFSERTKKDFHQKLLGLRAKDVGKDQWDGSYTPHDSIKWRKKYVPLMATFIKRWRVFQRWLDSDVASPKRSRRAYRFYEENGNFTDDELDNVEGEQLYFAYLKAEHDVLPLLGTEWDEKDRHDEGAFIRQQLGIGLVRPAPARDSLQDTLRYNRQFAQTLETARQRTNGKVLQARARFYDSLQQQVPWVRKWRTWGSVTGLRTTVEQPIFNVANRAQTYAEAYRDDYWRVQGAYNGFLEYERATIAGSVGGGTSNGLVFRKADLRTYQTSAWQRTGTDSVLVVTQKSLYTSRPDRVRYWNMQTQFTGTLNQGLPGVGLTSTYEVLFAPSSHAIHNLTLGLILPIKMDKSTLLFIPQARARGGDQPDRWSFGFTVTAAVPNFLLHALK